MSSQSGESRDDLLIKTIGMIDMIPDRLEKLESYIRVLETKFAHHEGQQEQGIKRISDRIEHIEKLSKTVHEESIRQLQELRNDISELHKIEGLTTDQKELIEEMKKSVDMLLQEYLDRKQTRKNIWHYCSVSLTYLIRYAMLPITIALMIFIGISPNIIPGYTPEKVSEYRIHQFNQASIDLISLVEDDKIIDSQMYTWITTCHKDLILISDKSKLNTYVKKDYRHFYIWNPKSHSQGFIQIYGEEGRAIGSKILIIRGK